MAVGCPTHREPPIRDDILINGLTRTAERRIDDGAITEHQSQHLLNHLGVTVRSGKTGLSTTMATNQSSCCLMHLPAQYRA